MRAYQIVVDIDDRCKSTQKPLSVNLFAIKTGNLCLLLSFIIFRWLLKCLFDSQMSEHIPTISIKWDKNATLVCFRAYAQEFTWKIVRDNVLVLQPLIKSIEFFLFSNRCVCRCMDSKNGFSTVQTDGNGSFHNEMNDGVHYDSIYRQSNKPLTIAIPLSIICSRLLRIKYARFGGWQIFNSKKTAEHACSSGVPSCGTFFLLDWMH